MRHLRCDVPFRPRKVLSTSDVKHCKGSGFDAAREKLVAKARQLELRQPDCLAVRNWKEYRRDKKDGKEATFYGGFKKAKATSSTASGSSCESLDE